MVGPPARMTLAGWCSVLPNSTENLMIGRLTTAHAPAAAAVDLGPGCLAQQIGRAALQAGQQLIQPLHLGAGELRQQRLVDLHDARQHAQCAEG